MKNHLQDCFNTNELVSSISFANKNQELYLKFARLFPTFLPTLRQHAPGITHNEQKLCIFIILGLSTTEIAALQNIAYKSVNMARYRLRLRMQLDAEIKLDDFLKELLSNKQ